MPLKGASPFRAARPMLLGLLVLLSFTAGYARILSSPGAAALVAPPVASALVPVSDASALVPVSGAVAVVPPTPVRSTSEPVTSSKAAWLQGFLPTPIDHESHASFLLPLPGGRMAAFWIDGNEGSREAVISSSVFDPNAQAWSAARMAASPAQTSADLGLHIRKVGNAVAHRGRDGRWWLFYVSVSIGGWGGSAINVRSSHDEGRSWTPARRLVVTPFLNLSTLVRHAVVEFDDGSIGIPVYHEFLQMFSQLLRIDSDGRVVDLQRLSDRYTTLQPQVLVRSSSDTLVLMRNGEARSPRQVLRTRSPDGGRHWVRTDLSTLPNPGSPVSGVVLPDGRVLIALNHASSRRRNLSLMLAGPGRENWTVAKVLEDERRLPEGRMARHDFLSNLESNARAAGATMAEAQRMAKFGAAVRCNADASCDVEYSYPSLAVADDGHIFLSYTWNRAFTRWLRFDPAWLREPSAAAQ